MAGNPSQDRRGPKETELPRGQFTFRIQMQIQVTNIFIDQYPFLLMFVGRMTPRGAFLRPLLLTVLSQPLKRSQVLSPVE